MVSGGLGRCDGCRAPVDRSTMEPWHTVLPENQASRNRTRGDLDIERDQRQLGSVSKRGEVCTGPQIRRTLLCLVQNRPTLRIIQPAPVKTAWHGLRGFGGEVVVKVHLNLRKYKESYNSFHATSELFTQNPVRLGVDLLFVCGAQFALMLHLGCAGLRISGVTGVRHGVFALLRKPKFFVRLRLPRRCC